ncbi:MAG: hypothetical protein H6668_01575 [Ardenticatenaceae bacterium]|nr:hypothetical protein [Ardenticatenaceae bacterium]
MVLPMPTSSNQNMSLFSHPNFHYDTVIYGLPGDSGSDTSPLGEQRIIGGQTLMTTSEITPMPTLTTLGIYQQPANSFLHLQDGLQRNETTMGNNFLISTGATVICIGCGPTGCFIGDLWYGEFDPGCTGICGI